MESAVAPPSLGGLPKHLGDIQPVGIPVSKPKPPRHRNAWVMTMNACRSSAGSTMIRCDPVTELTCQIFESLEMKVLQVRTVGV